MSVSGISATGLAAAGSQATPGKGAQVYSEALQLGRDLYAGNLSAAQSDYATLQKLVPDASSASAQANNPYAKDLTEIGTDLQRQPVGRAPDLCPGSRRDSPRGRPQTVPATRYGFAVGQFVHGASRLLAAEADSARNQFSVHGAKPCASSSFLTRSVRTFRPGTCQRRSRSMGRFSRPSSWRARA